MAHRYRFGEFLIDQQGFRLMQADTALAIEPKALNVLIFLAQNQGRLVERRELLSAVWGDAFVTDHVLNRAIGQLRKVLGDDAREPRYIETVPTLGYRFLAAVEVATLESAKPVVEVEPRGQLLPASASVPEQASAFELPETVPYTRVLAPDPTAPAAKPVSSNWLRSGGWLYGAGLIVALIAVVVSFAIEPTTPPPLESTQITFSTDPKERPIFTDGSRIYFERRREPSQMVVNGGAILPTRMLEPRLHLLDISADGSKVLAWREDGALWAEPTVGGAARKLADVAVDAAVWTPDGHSIVYSVLSALYVMDESGGYRVKLWEAPAPGQISDLALSPDGRQLCVTVEGEYVSRLWMLRADGTEAHLLNVEWPTTYDMRNARWTRDGVHFVFRSDGEGRQNMYEVVKPDWLHFWKKPRAVRLTGNQIEILASVPSRNTQELFVLGRLDQGAMQVFDPESKTLSPYLNGLSASLFVISPDGQWMAYIEYPSGKLWKSRVDGSGAVQLTDTVVHCPRWSPDGKSIAYTDWHKLYQVSADGGPSEKLIASGDHESPMTWSPDGRSIVFNYWDGVHMPHGLYVLDMATRKVSAMAGAESYFVPLWSPDGRYLAAIAENPSRIMLYSAESKTWKVLRTGPWEVYVWSPDSRSIYMPQKEDRNRIYRISVPDGSWDKVAEFDSVDANPDQSFVSLTSDGKPVIMSHTGVAQFYFLRWPH